MKKHLTFGNLKWFAALLGFIGAMTIATNTEYSKYAFLIFIVSSSIMMVDGKKRKDWAAFSLHSGFFIVDIVGIWRWFF